MTHTKPDLAKFTELVYPKLRAYISRRAPSSEVHDLVQETLRTVLEKGLEGVDNPVAYALGIARFKVLQHLDRRRPVGEFDSQRITFAQLTASLGTKIDRRTRVENALAELEERAVHAVEMRFVEELQLDEIREHLGVSLATVKRILADAATRLRAQLGDIGGEEQLATRLKADLD